MSLGVIEKLSQHIEEFLENWVKYMAAMGYLEYTTAKREDCILSFRGVIEPIRSALENSDEASFSRIMQDMRNTTDFSLDVARRHRDRGLTAEMYLGCFKTMIHSIEDIVLNLDVEAEDKLRAVTQLRKFFDAYETVFMGDWTKDSSDGETSASIISANRNLTLEKCKYENIFDSTSDFVLVTDGEGKISELNRGAVEFFGDVTGACCCETLGLPEDNMQSASESYLNKSTEISLKDKHFNLTLSDLSSVALASCGYMFILSDVTWLADSRKQLEQMVEKRTRDVARSVKHLNALFQSAGDGILLVNSELMVYKANYKACEIFDIDSGGFVGKRINSLLHPETTGRMDHFTWNLGDGESWSGDVQAYRNGSFFPASITVNRIDLDNNTFFHFIIRDISARKSMEENLIREKKQAEEMNITLRNVLKSIERDKTCVSEEIGHKIQGEVLPSIQKLSKENDPEIREMYENILTEQLNNLTKGSTSKASDAITRLSKTENRICRLIQGGYTTKEICENLNISFETAQTHRKNIRRKLGIKGKDVNLYSYLNLNDDDGSEPFKDL
ncbi:PAS domain S-box protein [Limisalsivibrio acetivorans]|uniref:PAS domain S-box protein n=1 Tax=Limisalsivibrio acetivorans TaxID=1304888 RepID=UPI0003B40822|nr:PAS domain S-box protein [Limisalsivibrio acetivorans]